MKNDYDDDNDYDNDYDDDVLFASNLSSTLSAL